METNDAIIRDILTTTARIAMVGASDKPDRPSYHVLKLLLEQGFDVTPVNPALAGHSLFGRPVVATLADAAPLDMVEIFRKSSETDAPIAEAIRLGARTIWLQLGVINEPAAQSARQAGLTMVMDRCPAIEIHRLAITRV